MARYIERAENTARLVNTYHFLLLDLPRGTRVGWDILPVITGGYNQFSERYQRHDERNTVKFLLADSNNPSSLINSIAFARENCRTSREVLPGHAWEQLNELKLYADARIGDALPRRGRFSILTEIIHRCQQLTGLLAGTMTHDHAYDFIRIGRNLERADMTTRIIDVAAATLLNRREDLDRLEAAGFEAFLIGESLLLAEAGARFVTGPSVNIYNQQTLKLLAGKGLCRWVLPVELGLEAGLADEIHATLQANRN